MNIMMQFSLMKESDMTGDDAYSRSSIFRLSFINDLSFLFFSTKSTQNQPLKRPLAQCAEHFDI